ncbi:matrixin family metalloprotease [Streptomyces poonensis]|uniref:matrixin family metalloprotease n=1 Tax=Streptomyces poonensis TaxID=68255 RepID=UPI001E2984C8|nr:matrixin family metalloprotease [Streptomyces poonensis]
MALFASLSALSGGAQAVGAPEDCVLEKGVLSMEDLPEGSSVIECDAVGRVVAHEGAALTVPRPGTAVGAEGLTPDGEVHGFSLEVADDGTISYTNDDDLSDPPVDMSVDGVDIPDDLSDVVETADDVTEEAEDDNADALDTALPDDALVEDLDDASAAGACSDGAYKTNDLKEYGTYNWYIGDGGMPGGLSRSAAKDAFADAINNITGSYNNCGYTDQVDASASYKGTTTYEADISKSNACTDRDGKSTWDAGDLSGFVAYACWWSWPTPGVKNDLREADVRFNTTDYDFTNKPTSSCSYKYDIRSVATHEAGHVFGMGHVGSGHDNLTMFTDSDPCATKARTLGKGDVLGLRSIY